MTIQRKRDHLEVCLDRPVETGSAGFENYSFVHNALPEINFQEIDTAITFLRKKLKAPILISSMTGGTEKGALINKNLAKATQSLGVAMGVGSQRVAIEQPDNQVVVSSFQVRRWAPEICLLANLGAVQLNYRFGIREIEKAVEMIRADALVLHLNSLQEAIQPEGNQNFKDLLPKIEKVVKALSVPVIVKEVGGGISKDVARRLKQVGVGIIDVAGRGGTNWAKIESFRQEKKDRWGEVFGSWGIRTAEAIVECRKIKGLKVVGSGGIRSGVDIAKAIALGADLAGLALPFLKPAAQSTLAVERKLNRLVQELKVAMFCVGAKNIDELKQAQLTKKQAN